MIYARYESVKTTQDLTGGEGEKPRKSSMTEQNFMNT